MVDATRTVVEKAYSELEKISAHVNAQMSVLGSNNKVIELWDTVLHRKPPDLVQPHRRFVVDAFVDTLLASSPSPRKEHLM